MIYLEQEKEVQEMNRQVLLYAGFILLLCAFTEPQGAYAGDAGIDIDYYGSVIRDPADIPELALSEEYVITELPDATDVHFVEETVTSYLKTVEYSKGNETELLKTASFTIFARPEVPSKESRYVPNSYDLCITDGVHTSVFEYGYVPGYGTNNNIILPYRFLSMNSPVVSEDINGNGKTDYLFYIDRGKYQYKSIVALEHSDNGFSKILDAGVFSYGGPESDDVADSVVFKAGSSKTDVLINMAPYNRMYRYTFSEADGEYKGNWNWSFGDEVRVYDPNLPLTVRRYGNHEIAVTDKRIYLKVQDDFYKITYSGDNETCGGYSIEMDSIRMFEVSETDFILQLSYFAVNLSYVRYSMKDQFFFICFRDNEWKVYKTTERNVNDYGIVHSSRTPIVLRQINAENDRISITYTKYSYSEGDTWASAVETKDTVINLD